MSAGLLNALSGYNRSNNVLQGVANPSALNPTSGTMSALQLATLLKQLQGGGANAGVGMGGAGGMGNNTGILGNLSPLQLQLLLHLYGGGASQLGGNQANVTNPLSMNRS